MADECRKKDETKRAKCANLYFFKGRKKRTLDQRFFLPLSMLTLQSVQD